MFDKGRGVRTTAATMAIEGNLVRHLVDSEQVDLKLKVLPASPPMAKTL